MFGKWKDFVVVVHRIHQSNIDSLTKAMDGLEPFMEDEAKTNEDNGGTEYPISTAWSTLHMARAMLEGAQKNRHLFHLSFKPFNLRIGRVHSFTASVGCRCKRGKCKSMLWLQLFGFSVGVPTSRWSR